MDGKMMERAGGGLVARAMADAGCCTGLCEDGKSINAQFETHQVEKRKKKEEKHGKGVAEGPRTCCWRKLRGARGNNPSVFLMTSQLSPSSLDPERTGWQTRRQILRSASLVPLVKKERELRRCVKLARQAKVGVGSFKIKPVPLHFYFDRDSLQ